MTTPVRPAGVPAAARFVPPAETFAELEALNSQRPDQRSYLRVSFPFVLWNPRGCLRWATSRALSVSKPGRQGRCYVFNSEGQVPGVWVWTLADERAEEAS